MQWDISILYSFNLYDLSWFFSPLSFLLYHFIPSKSVKILDCKLWESKNWMFMCWMLCGNESIFLNIFFLLCENCMKWKLQNISYVGFSLKWKSQLISHVCQWLWEDANFLGNLPTAFTTLPRNAKTCRQVPTNANKHQENCCWQFAVFVGKRGCQGHATSAKIFANNLLEGQYCM